MITSFRLWLALKICPYLLDELSALRSGNTKLILENARLMDAALASGKDA